MGNKDHKDDPHRVSALAHFGTGTIVVILVALLSSSLHERSILRDMQATSLDVFFLAHQKIQGTGDIAVVDVTDQDYTELFHRQSPLNPAVLSDLIVACGKSGAAVIGVDFITSDWTAEQRSSARERLKTVAPNARLVWADDGWLDADGKLHISRLTGLDKDRNTDCEAAPAAIPDEYGIVRGFLPVVPALEGDTQKTLPSMATVLHALYRSKIKGCTPEGAQDASTEERIVNYSGGGAAFTHLSAATVLKASAGAAWIHANPLQGHIVLVGGSYREARDRYATPAGYMDGVDILAQTVLSNDRSIVTTSKTWFTIVDLMVGMLLLTSTWFLHRVWVLILSFLLIPIVAMAASYIAFTGFGYFVSFVPVVAGVFLHHLVEHAIEHWKLTREVAVLRANARA